MRKSHLVAITLTLLALVTYFIAPAHAELDVLERPAYMSQRVGSAVLISVARAGNRLVALGERGIVMLSDDNGVSWRQASVPVSVSLTKVYFATSKDGWAVGHSGVVLNTKDGGVTWIKQLDGNKAAQLIAIAARAVSSQNTDTEQRVTEALRLVAEGPDKPFFDVYFANGKQGFIVGAYGLLFGTEDGGATWNSWQDRIPNPNGKHLYGISAAGTSIYIAGEQGALFHSLDGGKTFAEITTPYSGSYFGVLQAQGNVIIYGLGGNAYWSNDSGKNWMKIEMNTSVALTAGLQLTDGSVVLANQAGGVLRSTDDGRRFRLLPIAPAFPFTGVAETTDGGLVLSGVRGLTRVASPR